MKDLSKLELKDLHILKENAHITLSKLERLMGNLSWNSSTMEYKEFETFSNIYHLLEDEMNKRIMDAVI